MESIQEGVRALLVGIGELPEREGLRDTPKVRKVLAWRLLQRSPRPARTQSRSVAAVRRRAFVSLLGSLCFSGRVSKVALAPRAPPRAFAPLPLQPLTAHAPPHAAQRVAKALLFALRGYGQSAAGVLGDALFTERALGAPLDTAALSGSEDSEDVFEVPLPTVGGGLVVVRHIDLFSTSAHDLQPFFGRVHVGYLPAAGRIVGLSKTARIAEVFARRLQTPQQLADDIAVWPPSRVSRPRRLTGSAQAGLEEVASPQGVAVLLETWSLADAAASVAAAEPSSSRQATSTCASLRGCFLGEASWWEEFRALVELDRTCVRCADLLRLTAPPAPCASSEDGTHPCGCADAALCDDQDGSEALMSDAVAQMLLSAGERPDRPGLAGTPGRYVRALRSATAGYGREVQSVVAEAVRLSRLAAAAPAGAQGSPASLNCSSSSSQGSGCCFEEHELPVVSMCEHHLLPFYGTAHLALAYAHAPGATQAPRLPRAALQAVLDVFARRLQVQERLTHQLAEAVMSVSGAQGVMAVTEAAHMCMASRGVEKTASSTCSTAALGSYATDAASRARFLASLGARRAAGRAELDSAPRCSAPCV